jgi:hypothetical protein
VRIFPRLYRRNGDRMAISKRCAPVEKEPAILVIAMACLAMTVARPAQAANTGDAKKIAASLADACDAIRTP